MSKLIENSQRDMLAYMNEVFKICDNYNLNFNSVLKAAKPNGILNFYPGLLEDIALQ